MLRLLKNNGLFYGLTAKKFFPFVYESSHDSVFGVGILSTLVSGFPKDTDVWKNSAIGSAVK